MASLGRIDSLRHVLSKGRRENIALLHKFVFQFGGDRNSRQRLRDFVGFDFSQDDEGFKSLQEYVTANFESSELVTICNMLGIDYKADDLFVHIFNNLSKGGLLCSVNAVDDTDDESDDDFDDNEDDHRNDAVVQRNEERDEANSGTSDNDQYNEAEGELESEIRCDKQYGKSDDGVNRETGKVKRRSMTSQNKTIKSNNELRQRQQRKQNSVKNFTVAAENIVTPKFVLNFRDVEDSIRPFSGDDLLSIDVWLNEFEDISVMMQWDDLQKFIFAKKSIKGLARTYLMSERGINNWFKLKNALINEFKESTNSAELHKLMCSRKIKKNESCQEYFLNMKELASRGNIEEEALMQYVIEGINDLNINKIILYGAKNLREFKEKLKCYESISGKDRAVNLKVNKKPAEQQGKEAKNILCYNCGMKGHVSSNCSNKSKGMKCFKCSDYGHIAKHCTIKQNENAPNANTRVLSIKDDSMVKEIKINNLKCRALFDTGSKCHIITKRMHIRLKEPKHRESKNILGWIWKKDK
ncbi:uncharacterized protein LOC119687237 [Teleopsis dalmanni]|uniref:uncharacterized protein LOC119687237 n=1 Tax=Teleopsis dalmanni TaxID=139649 RepID=UPI0018CD1234|nr:uncharacterized protein LOC119687237 [Teleopsis dalmanni]